MSSSIDIPEFLEHLKDNQFLVKFKQNTKDISILTEQLISIDIEQTHVDVVRCRCKFAVDNYLIVKSTLYDILRNNIIINEIELLLGEAIHSGEGAIKFSNIFVSETKPLQMFLTYEHNPSNPIIDDLVFTATVTW